MGRIIAIGNEKGGTGKTTAAVNLAALAAAAGHDVILVDGDPHQQSSARWAARRDEFHPEAMRVNSVGLTGRTMERGLQDLARRYGVVVVDTGASDGPEIRGAAVVADVLLVPFQPEPADLWTLPTMETLVERARHHNPKLRVVAMVNRIPHQNRDVVTVEMRSWISGNVPGLEPSDIVPIVGRTAYGRAFGEGLAVSEPAKRDTKAVVEMQMLWEAVSREDTAR